MISTDSASRPGNSLLLSRRWSGRLTSVDRPDLLQAMSSQPEKLIENQILTYLFKRGIFAWKNQSVGIYDPVKRIYRKNNNPFHIKGVSDILGILPGGRILAIEVKTEKGRVSPEQQFFIQKINDRGGLAFVARSIYDVEKELANHDSGNTSGP
jgi:hypothetical protein